MSVLTELYLPISRRIASKQIRADELTTDHELLTIQEGNLSVEFGIRQSLSRVETGETGLIYVLLTSESTRIILNPDHKVTVVAN